LETYFLGRPENFQGHVAVKLNTPLTIRERIDTNMSTIPMYCMIRHVVLGDVSDMMTDKRSMCSFTGTVSADHHLRQCLMVDLVHVFFVINKSRFFVLLLILLIGKSANCQSWELQKLNVVQCQFLE
jgi:hypothetical protein